MPKATITLDEQQVDRLEQAVIDHDEVVAWELLHQIRNKIKSSGGTTCGIEKLRQDSGQKPFR